LSTDAPSPDLEIVVRTLHEGSQTRLSYTLHSPRGVVPFLHKTIEGPVFTGSPEELHRHLLQQVEQLGERREHDGTLVLHEEVERHLDGLGRELWDRLFNDPMRLAYRRFRSGIRTLLIISDEPWIPWEMVKPFEDDDDPLNDEFLAERFELTRWMMGKRTAAAEITVQRFAFVAGKLPLASKERDLITGLAHSGDGLKDASPASPGAEALLALLEQGGVGLLHFATHGTFEPTLPDQAGIPLEDGSVFRPAYLHGPTQTQIGKDRPLVFLNVCSSGRQAWSWTGLGGWADRWVRVCGCGAFLGPQWKVRDSAAFAFARGFYGALGRGEALGKAAWLGRQEARQATPGDPSWLAYTVYGHPNARVRFGTDTDTGTGTGTGTGTAAALTQIADLSKMPPASPVPAKPAPTNAPPAPDIFVGRTADLDRLKERLGIGRDREQEPEVQILTAVRGWPGVGKSSLAAVLAHDPDLSSRFEGVLWASLGQEPDLLGEVTRWGRWLGSDDLYRAASLKEALDSLLALLRNRRLLLILDDVWAAAHAVPFQKVRGAGCALLLTTRETGLAQALAPRANAVYPLDVLDEVSALELLRRLAPEVVEAYPGECRRLVDELECLPLALQVAGRLLREEISLGWGVDDLLRELGEGTAILKGAAPVDRQDVPGEALLTVEALFERSTGRLGDETRECFRLLGGFVSKPGTFGLDALRLAWEVEDPRPTVRELVRRGLLEPAEAGRFQIHALLLRHAENLSSDRS
jgi:NB-ARC domain/CHAT domain